MVATHDDAEIIERIAALDVGKEQVVCCIRTPEADAGRRCQRVRSFATMTRSLTELADWLAEHGVTRVVMEATSDYWKPPFYVLEAAGFDVWLVNAHEVKHLRGRPKTDTLDAVWLCKVAERQMIRPSFVPPQPIRRLRNLTRYRVDLVEDRTREKNRVEKLLEDAGIKLSVVASDLFGVSGRAIMHALIDGERDPRVLAELARTRLRAKIPQLREALTGRFTDHHAFLLAEMLGHVDDLDSRIEAVEAHLSQELGPFAGVITRLDEIPGVGSAAAAMILAEIGTDMTRFPTPAHLASWAKFSPTVKESAGKPVGKPTTGRGNRYLARALGEAVVAAAHTDTFLGERYRRLARRRGKKKALVAVGRSMLTIIWHLLSSPDSTFVELGSDHYDNHGSTHRAIRRHLNALHALGYDVIVTPAARPTLPPCARNARPCRRASQATLLA